MCIIRRNYYWSIALKQKEHNNRWCGNTSLFLFITTYTCGNDNAMITNFLLRVNLRPLTAAAFFPHRDAVVGVGNGENVPDDRPAETPDGGFEVVEEDGVVVVVVTIITAFGPDVHFAALRRPKQFVGRWNRRCSAPIGRLLPNPRGLEALSSVAIVVVDYNYYYLLLLRW